MFNGEINYFDWAIFNSSVKLSEGIGCHNQIECVGDSSRAVSLHVQISFRNHTMQVPMQFEPWTFPFSPLLRSASKFHSSWLNRSIKITFCGLFSLISPWNIPILNAWAHNEVPLLMLRPLCLNVWFMTKWYGHYSKGPLDGYSGITRLNASNKHI